MAMNLFFVAVVITMSTEPILQYWKRKKGESRTVLWSVDVSYDGESIIRRIP